MNRPPTSQAQLLHTGLERRHAFCQAAVRVRETLMRHNTPTPILHFPPQQWQALSHALDALNTDPTLHPLERYLLDYARRTHPLIGQAMHHDVPDYAQIRAQWHLALALLLTIYGDPAAEGETQLLLERAPQVLEKIGLSLDDLPQGLRNLDPAPWYPRSESRS